MGHGYADRYCFCSGAGRRYSREASSLRRVPHWVAVALALGLAGCASMAAASDPSTAALAAPGATTASPSPIPAGPPSATDWSSEYHGRGGLTVTVRNGSTVPVFVKIRDNAIQSTAAQVPVAGGQETSIRLGSGNFEVLMRAELNGHYRYFKGPPVSVPANAKGTAVLSVGVPGSGESLEEIDSGEFNR